MEKFRIFLGENIKKLVAGTLLCLVMFLAVFSGVQHLSTNAANAYTFMNRDGSVISGTVTIRSVLERISVSGATDSTKFVWESTDPEVLQVSSNGVAGSYGQIANTAGSVGNQVYLKALKTGEVGIHVVATDGTDVQQFDFSLTVKFSINEYMLTSENGSMTRIFDEDERKSVVMDYGDFLEFGYSAIEEESKLNLIFGSAVDSSTTSWTSANRDVIEVTGASTGSGISAVGAGHTTLSVTYVNGTEEFSDSIEVYVRPQIRNAAGTDLTAIDTAIEMNDGDELTPTVSFLNNSLEPISNKLVWVIAKDVGENTVLIKDSMGNTNPDYEDNVTLVYQEDSQKYRLDAKAGTYKIQFYVADTYKDFATAQAKAPGCRPVNVGNGINVLSNYGNMDKTINVYGSFDISEAFNISVNDLQNYFSVAIDGTGNDYISLDNSTMVITADKGKTGGPVKVTVTPKSGVSIPVPGVSSTSPVANITLNIAETFSLNVSSTSLSVGEQLTLYGILGSGVATETSQFSWSTDDEKNTYITLTPNGQYGNIVAKKETPAGTTVNVTLKWTSSDGVSLAAQCSITVTSTAGKFTIKQNPLTLNVGETQVINTSLSGNYNLIWLTSDEKVVKVVKADNQNNPSAQVTAMGPGTAVVTVLNPINESSATCLVTVHQAIESLDIQVIEGNKKKVITGETYNTYMSKQYVFLSATWKPKNATETEDDLVWSVIGTTDSPDPDKVAIIEQNGTITLVGEGTVDVKVESSKASAMCRLLVTSNPMTEIVPDVEKLDMVKGDTYEVETTYYPEDASDTRMTWESTNESVAKVDENGKISAVGVGTAYIIVTSVLAQKDEESTRASARIQVNVRNKLLAIALDSTSQYIAVGESYMMSVSYSPATDVNDALVWSSSDTSIFTVDQKGTIKGISEGVAMLTVYAEDLGQAKALTCMIYVTAATVVAKDFNISPTEDTVYIGSTLQLESIFTPTNVTDKTVKWTSSDDKIAKVDDFGLVTGVAEGQVIISATYMDSNNENKQWTKTSQLTVTKAPINAEDFTISPDTQNIIAGESFTLAASFTPKDTTNQNVTYQSLDTEVATVTEDGVVTGVGPGDAIIQCQAEDGGFIDTCQVHVDAAIEFSLDPSERELSVGSTITIKKVTNPADASKKATWQTSNASVATVSDTGKVKAKAIGTCTITCTLTKYKQSAKCKIKVRKLKSSVALSKNSIRIGIRQSYTLKATVSSNANPAPGVKWSTSNRRIVSVNSKGKITGVRVGYATITATTQDIIKAKAKCRVSVVNRVTSIRLNKDFLNIYEGKTKQLRAIVKPSKATVKKVKWTSSDTSVADVTGSGKVRGISAGTAEVTAATTDGSNKKAKCYVTVMEAVPITGITVAQSDMTMKLGDTVKISYTTLPNKNSDSLKFASDNKRVATVSNSGKVKAVGTGSANITILATSGVTTTVKVYVVTLDKSSLNIRQYDTATLNVLGLPAGASVSWYSSNQRVATVVGGKVVGRDKGTAYIYAYVNGCKLACKVTITSINS